jgi:hypothetical protein
MSYQIYDEWRERDEERKKRTGSLELTLSRLQHEL